MPENQICEKCQNNVAPTNKEMIVYYKDKQYLEAFERYHCNCGWIWATLEQRIKNNNLING